METGGSHSMVQAPTTRFIRRWCIPLQCPSSSGFVVILMIPIVLKWFPGTYQSSRGCGGRVQLYSCFHSSYASDTIPTLQMWCREYHMCFVVWETDYEICLRLTMNPKTTCLNETANLITYRRAGKHNKVPNKVICFPSSLTCRSQALFCFRITNNSGPGIWSSLISMTVPVEEIQVAYTGVQWLTDLLLTVSKMTAIRLPVSCEEGFDERDTLTCPYTTY